MKWKPAAELQESWRLRGNLSKRVGDALTAADMEDRTEHYILRNPTRFQIQVSPAGSNNQYPFYLWIVTHEGGNWVVRTWTLPHGHLVPNSEHFGTMDEVFDEAAQRVVRFERRTAEFEPVMQQNLQVGRYVEYSPTWRVIVTDVTDGVVTLQSNDNTQRIPVTRWLAWLNERTVLGWPTGRIVDFEGD